MKGEAFIIVVILSYFTTPPFDSAIVRRNYPNAIIFIEELDTWEMPQKEFNFSNLQGDYFGQTPPGNIPEVFAPNLISSKGRLYSLPTLSPDYSELYWQILRPQIMLTKRITGEWTTAQAASFSNTAYNQAPFIANDNTIYFASSREVGKGSMDIWYITKMENTINQYFYLNPLT